MNKLEQLGFAGSISWVHNEEGSGARYHNSSAYYPDSTTAPLSASGITIDPGVDLGSANWQLVENVIKVYKKAGLLSRGQVNLLWVAKGVKKYGAIEWWREYKNHFRGKFLVPAELAAKVMEEITAPEYWEPLVKSLPELLEIKLPHLAAAVHTALLSYSYNRGSGEAIQLAKPFLQNKDYNGLGRAIKAVHHAMESLNERRQREGNIILAAVKLAERFELSLNTEINPRPLTAIPADQKEFIK